MSDVEQNPKVKQFLEEVLAVCRAHGMSLSHEDGHGAFLIEPFSEFNAGWLMDAFVAPELQEPGRAD